jgi:hydrogenase maturation protein HypF
MVQGVGFRPFVYTLATALGLGGWVRNNGNGVDIEIEGSAESLAAFLTRIAQDCPTHTVLSRLETNWLNPCGDDQFEIRPSAPAPANNTVWLLPDLATCPACLQEIQDPSNRRYGYPFTNCTHCGPRYSILTAFPYDRSRTTMQNFCMCPACQREYEQPQDRRFHAQPNACPNCGPEVSLWDSDGREIAPAAPSATRIAQAAAAIREGQVLALKGLGGFHLMVDARNEGAVQRLRERKHRPTKPLAVMYPSLEAIQEDCVVSAAAAELLTSVTAPIVLLHRQSNRLAPSLAPHQQTLGVMMPYTPLHHLLLAELGFPVVATSGNRTQAPICIDERLALRELADIADVFLIHNRPIARPVDDSVVRFIDDQPMVVRRARGYAGTVNFSATDIPCILAVGGHLKNTVALSLPEQLLLSPHLGDLTEARTYGRFQETVDQLLTLYAAQPLAIACDAHPEYASTHFAQALGQRLNIPVIPIQHHYAHILAGMVDNVLEPPVLGITWDGTGYGTDGTLWGGEFLLVPDRNGFQRVAHVRPFPLPGGDRAAREPRRAALGLLYAALGEAAFTLNCPTLQAFSPEEQQVLPTMLRNGLNTSMTSSLGRLLDAVASLIGVCQFNSFEGEAAMWLEALLEHSSALYPYHLQESDGGLVLDWQPLLQAILMTQASVREVATRLHNTLIEMLVAVAHRVGCPQVLLTGGCFQNRYLLERALRRLRAEGFTPYCHHQIPPNDGGLAVGQVLGAHWILQQQGGGLPCV